MARSDVKALSGERSLAVQLKAKSRRRREASGRLASPSAAPRTLRNDVAPALEFDYVSVADLRPSARRLRKLDPAHVSEVAGSISALGFCVPVLIGKSNAVLDGEIRIAAAKLLGLDRIPCLRVDHLTEDEQRVLRLAVNRLAEKGQWDLDELKIEFEELIVADAPIEVSGFTLDEIDHISLGDEPQSVEQGVNRRAKLIPDRRPKLTPLS